MIGSGSTSWCIFRFNQPGGAEYPAGPGDPARPTPGYTHPTAQPQSSGFIHDGVEVSAGGHAVRG